RPVDIPELDACFFQHAPSGLVAIDGVLELLDALLGPVDQQYVSRHSPLPRLTRRSYASRSATRLRCVSVKSVQRKSAPSAPGRPLSNWDSRTRNPGAATGAARFAPSARHLWIESA